MSRFSIDDDHPTKVLLALLEDDKKSVKINEVHALVRAGADVNEVIWGLLTNHEIDPVESVKLLEQAGLDITQSHARNTLYYAAQNNQFEVAKYLLGQHPNLRDNPTYEGKTPLMAACIYSSLAMVKLLLDAGADCHAKDYSGNTVIHSAVCSHDPEIVTEVIRRGVPLDERNNEGNTALHHCALWGLDKTAAALIKGGMDINARNSKNRTSLWVAMIENRPRTAKLLVEYGADPTADKGYSNPIGIAISDKSEEVLRAMASWMLKNNKKDELQDWGLEKYTQTGGDGNRASDDVSSDSSDDSDDVSSDSSDD